TITAHDGPHADNADSEREKIELLDWLRALGRPAGILAANDVRARKLLDICQSAGIKVPEDVAIVGVDNDPLICLTARPTLSSIALPFERIGYEAAELLDRMMHGEALPEKPIVFPPLGVMARDSTDIVAIEDLVVSRALYFLRQHADKDISMDDVANALGVNRRTLERRFAKQVGRSLHQELTRLRIEISRRLLSETDLPMPDVARRSGLTSATQLSVIFRRETGWTPREYRRRFRYASAAVER
ncbi:MAG: substrate-binding domain-containing protein, partial [Planctomycetota bacterium]|nr:substrate-binding domain-containing protein [Planctomycetota bacterium]